MKLTDILKIATKGVRLYRKARTAEDALRGVTRIVNTLDGVQKERLNRAKLASDVACAYEDEIAALEKKIEAANAKWQAEVEERNKALHAMQVVRQSFGLDLSKD